MTNEETAFRYFVAKGLTSAQSAGVVGNLLQESGLNPRIAGLERGGYYAHGIAQWGTERWAALQSWAASQGRDPDALDTQLAYVWRELETIPMLGFAELRAAQTIEDATLAFEKKYERPAAGSSALRLAKAKATYAKFVSAPEPPPFTMSGYQSGLPSRGQTIAGVAILALFGAALAIHHYKAETARA